MSTAPNRQFWLIVYFYLLSFIIFPLLSQNFILPQNWTSYIPAASTPFTSSVDNNYFSLLNRKCFRCGRVSSVRVNSYLAGSRTSLRRQLHFLWKWAQNVSIKVMGIEGTASRKVWNKFARKCREVAWGALLRNPIPQKGGPGVIMQIDESKFNQKSKVSIEKERRPLGRTIRKVYRPQNFEQKRDCT